MPQLQVLTALDNLICRKSPSCAHPLGALCTFCLDDTLPLSKSVKTGINTARARNTAASSCIRFQTERCPQTRDRCARFSLSIRRISFSEVKYSLNPPRSDTSISSPLHHPRKSVSIIPGGALQPPTVRPKAYQQSPTTFTESELRLSLRPTATYQEPLDFSSRRLSLLVQSETVLERGFLSISSLYDRRERATG